LPGRWYLQVIKQLFKENRLAKGEFVALGRKLNLRDIKYLGTPRDRIVQKTVPGGHIGLFMGARTLKEYWPSIAQWITDQ
jgi:poly(3-hydroxyalkanoate) synthetase